MANLASALKDEVVRLAKKEIRIETQSLKKSSAEYRSDIAALKRHVGQLQKQVARLEKSISRQPQTEPETLIAHKVRFTAKGFITLRKRLGLSATEAASLIGVTAQSIYSWEAGRSSPRAQQLANIAVLRGMGKKEVRAVLEKHA